MTKTTGELIDAYIQLRDKRDALREEHKEALAPYNEAMTKLEIHFQRIMEAQDLKDLKSDHGTAYQSHQVSVTVADWDAFKDYIEGNNAWFLLDKRAAKKAVQEVVEETGELPPGLDMKRSIKINVRRS